MIDASARHGGLARLIGQADDAQIAVFARPVQILLAASVADVHKHTRGIELGRLRHAVRQGTRGIDERIARLAPQAHVEPQWRLHGIENDMLQAVQLR